MDKVTKAQAGYLERPGTEYVCGDCVSLTKGDGCYYFSKDDTVSVKSGSCNRFALGKSLGLSPQGLFTKDALGYMENGPGFGCKRCEYFGVGKADCEQVNKDTPGDSPGKISFYGCCDFWDKDGKRGQMSSSDLVQINKFHFKPSGAKDAPERSRGIADITLSRQGKADVDKLGRDLSNLDHIDIIYTSPLWRCQQTAKAIQRYSPSAKIAVVDALMTWGYGSQEGGDEKYTTKVLLKYAEKKPDTPVPGVGPISGARGNAFNKWKETFLKKGLLPILRIVERYPELVVAIVLHSRDIYTLEGWISAGMPRSLAIDFSEMKDGDHAPGEVATIEKTPGGMWKTEWLDPTDKAEDLGRDKAKAIFIRHGSTNFNEGVAA